VRPVGHPEGPDADDGWARQEPGGVLLRGQKTLLLQTSLATGNTTSAAECQTNVSNTSEDLLTIAPSQPEEPLPQHSKQNELIEIDQENENAKEEQQQQQSSSNQTDQNMSTQLNTEENSRENLPSLLTTIELQKPILLDPPVLSN